MLLMRQSLYKFQDSISADTVVYELAVLACADGGKSNLAAQLLNEMPAMTELKNTGHNNCSNPKHPIMIVKDRFFGVQVGPESGHSN